MTRNLSYARDDHPAGERAGRGARWKLASRDQEDEFEVYGLKFDGELYGMRISITDFCIDPVRGSHASVCVDMTSAAEFANEILRLVELAKTAAVVLDTDEDGRP